MKSFLRVKIFLLFSFGFGFLGVLAIIRFLFLCFLPFYAASRFGWFSGFKFKLK